MSAKVMKWGNGLGVLIPAFAARSLGLAAGSPIRLLVLDDEIRIRAATGRAQGVSSTVAATSHAEQVREILTKW